MLKKFASDSLGLSDIGQFIPEDKFQEVDVVQYCLPSETPFIVLRSKSDEYCFTNKALIHLDGTSAMSKKRVLKRYTYKHHKVSRVILETAGTIDLDAEVKFQLGERSDELNFSLDVDKKQLPALILLYQALMMISEEQGHNYRHAQNIREAVNDSIRLFENIERMQFGKCVEHTVDDGDAISTALKDSCSYLETRKEEVNKYIHHDDFTHIFTTILEKGVEV